MSKISNLASDLSHLSKSLKTSKSDNIKADIVKLQKRYPGLGNQMNGIIRDELKTIGINNDEIDALLTPRKPTSVNRKSVYMKAQVQSTKRNKVIISPIEKNTDKEDRTENASLSKFKKEYKRSKATGKMFIGRNIEEDKDFLKCRCPRCNGTSFIIKRYSDHDGNSVN